MSLGLQYAGMAPTEVTCACRYRTGSYSHEYCGNAAYSHIKMSELNKWQYCDYCYEGKCEYCKQYRATRDL